MPSFHLFMSNIPYAFKRPDRESAGSPCDVVSGTYVAMALVFTISKWRQCSGASFGHFFSIRWTPDKISMKFIWICGHVFLNLRHNSFVTETRLIRVVCQNGGKFSRLKTFIKNSRLFKSKIFFAEVPFSMRTFTWKNKKNGDMGTLI